MVRKSKNILDHIRKYQVLEGLDSIEGLSLKEHYIRHLNEVSERRKKKDLCSKEAKLPSLNLSRSEEAE